MKPPILTIEATTAIVAAILIGSGRESDHAAAVHQARLIVARSILPEADVANEEPAPPSLDDPPKGGIN
jgi:hypothetical protein